MGLTIDSSRGPKITFLLSDVINRYSGFIYQLNELNGSSNYIYIVIYICIFNTLDQLFDSYDEAFKNGI